MKRWTIEVDDEVAMRVTEAATDRGVAPEQLLGEAVTEKVHFSASLRLRGQAPLRS